MTPDEIPRGSDAVVCITDRNYLLPTKVMLSSLVRVLSPDVRIFVLSRDVTLQDFSDTALSGRLSGVVDYSSSTHFAELSKTSFRGRTHVSGDAMAKLLLPFLFQGYQRVLYLDVDMICCSAEINRLFELELGSSLIAAVPDAKIARHPFREVLDLAPENPYFNSGLVLFDVPKCLAWLTERLVIERTAAIAPRVRFVDQDTLNYIYRNKVHYLDLRFNVFANVHMGGGKTLPLEDVPKIAGESFMAYPAAELARALRERVVLHYTSSSKPWKTSCGHDELWWREYEALGLGRGGGKRRAPPGSSWSRALGRVKLTLREPRKAVGRAVGLSELRQLRQQLETLTRRQAELRDEWAGARPETVRSSVVLDLRWAREPEVLSFELERIFSRYDFAAGVTVLVDGVFAAQLSELARAWGATFALDEGGLGEGYHFRTQLFAGPVWPLYAELASLRLGRSVRPAQLGAWLEVRAGGRPEVRARSGPPGPETLARFPSARYDDVLAGLYRSARDEGARPAGASSAPLGERRE